MRVDLLGETDCLLDSLLGLAGEAQNKGSMDDDAKFVAIFGEAAGDVDSHALLDIVQDLLIAGLVSDKQQAQAIIFHHLQRLAWNVGLGVAGPGQPEFTDFLGQRLDARQVVGQRVIVEEEFLHLREGRLSPTQLLDNMAYAAYAIAMAADGLRPEAEGAARFAATARVERNVRVLEIADEIVLDDEVAFIDRRYEAQHVHVLEDWAVLVVHDDAIGFAV